MKKCKHYCDICGQKVIKRRRKDQLLREMLYTLITLDFDKTERDYFGWKKEDTDICAECHEEFERWIRWRIKTTNLRSIRSKNTKDKSTQE